MFNEIDISALDEKLSSILQSISYFLPEACLAIFLMLLIVFDLVFKREKKIIFILLSLAALCTTFLLLLSQWSHIRAAGPATLFLGMLTVDGTALYFKSIFCLASVVTILFAATYTFKQEQISRMGEFYILLFGLLIGTYLMTMAVNLLLIYIAIELVSVSSYILTHFNFGKKSVEASMKYLLFGALSSGIMLYGISLLYGFTGTLDITAYDFISGLQKIETIPLTLAAFMTVGGFLFKISSVPFHIWTPDVYEGAPTPVVAFFSVVPKLGGLVILIRFISVFNGESLIPENIALNFDWQLILAVIAMATMIIGNFSALWQTKPKRMMAYSSIAHAGFLLSGVVAGSWFGIQSILFYAVVYFMMNFGAFIVISIIAAKTGIESFSGYKGQGVKYPALGVAMIIIMIALTGLPPTAGFTAKLLIFSSLWEAYQTSANDILLYLFIVGLFNTVISLFYYLKIPYFLFFKETTTELNVLKKLTVLENILVAGLTIPLLILFFKSDWLLNIITSIKFTF